MHKETYNTVSNTTTTTTIILRPLYKTTCISRHHNEELEDFVGAKYYCPHALGDGTSLQTDYHASTSSMNILQAGCSPDAQPSVLQHRRQYYHGNNNIIIIIIITIIIIIIIIYLKHGQYQIRVLNL